MSKPVVYLIVVCLFSILIFGGLGYFLGSKLGSKPDNELLSSPKSDDQLTEFAPLSYTANDELFTVDRRTIPAKEVLPSASELTDQSEECGAGIGHQRAENALATFTDADNATQYSFTYKGESQDDGTWVVTVLPNKPQYGNMLEFERDFELCVAGGDMYPTQVTSNYLLFTASSGTGLDDGSGLPHGREVVRDYVEPTVILQ